MQAGDQSRAARDGVAGDHRVHLLAGFQRSHRRRRRRRHQIRIKHIQHGARKARALRVDLQPRARGKKGHAVEQPFDIRVGARDRVEGKIAGDRRMHVGEFRGQRADMGKFLFVILYEDPIHLRSPAIRFAPGRCRD